MICPKLDLLVYVHNNLFVCVCVLYITKYSVFFQKNVDSFAQK